MLQESISLKPALIFHKMFFPDPLLPERLPDRSWKNHREQAHRIQPAAAGIFPHGAASNSMSANISCLEAASADRLLRVLSVYTYNGCLQCYSFAPAISIIARMRFCLVAGFFALISR